ncbi:hypothetical protein PR202_ga24729 [Eleusine coracana subsp. coracana]|uniref:VWFA domain-containing protein n=1 Tax=Eleusine coracana subsp. coracana TaxID=191504 RepID=A0AAV5D9H7_ELECO|nr:hypothetical protein PR202_ga24729 [Eleusine coracana subsp. coracana]
MKRAMMFVIDNLGPDDRLSVVSFSSHTQRQMDLTIMSDENRELARQVVIKLMAEGGTDMGPAVEEATVILRQRGPEERSSRVGRIIFLSDGEDNFILHRHMSSEFPAETFGLDAHHDPKALRYIADRTMGVYSYVNQDLDTIKHAFAQSLGGLMSVTTMDIQVNLQTVDGITISYIHSGSYRTSITSDKRSATIEVPDLYAGEQKNFIVYLNVPEGKQNHQFLTVNGSYRNPKISKEARIQLDDSDLAVLLPNVEANTSDKTTVCPDVAAELIRLQLMEYVSTMADDATPGVLPRLWEEIKCSEHGRSAPESAVLALDDDVAEMQHEGKPFIFSWLTSHQSQRATTKGSPSKSHAFRVNAMEEMMKKVEA